MTDSSSAELLDEIRAKQRRITFWPLALIALLFLWFVVAAQVPPWANAFLLVAATVLVLWVSRIDRLRKTVVLFYDLDGPLEVAYEGFHNGFDWLASSQRVWHLEAQGRIGDWKRQAGANTLVRRQWVRPVKAAPKNLQTNIAVPSLPVGRQTLYFLPDRILVYEGRAVGAIAYGDFEVQASDTQFIESESVPSDAQVISHTWQYVNKKGGPDKRFKDNRQLPVVLYSEMRLTSVSGLNEGVQTSNREAPASFAQGVRALADALGEIEGAASREQDPEQQRRRSDTSGQIVDVLEQLHVPKPASAINPK